MRAIGDKKESAADQQSLQSGLVTPVDDQLPAVVPKMRVVPLRCAECETVWAQLQSGCLVVKARHHGQRHVTVVAVDDLVKMCQGGSLSVEDVRISKDAARIWVAALSRWPGVNPDTKIVEVEDIPEWERERQRLEREKFPTVDPSGAEEERVELEEIGGGVSIGYSPRLDMLVVRREI